MDDDDDVMIPGDDSTFLADVKARVTAILILEPDAGMSAQQFAQIYKHEFGHDFDVHDCGDYADLEAFLRSPEMSSTVNCLLIEPDESAFAIQPTKRAAQWRFWLKPNSRLDHITRNLAATNAYLDQRKASDEYRKMRRRVDAQQQPAYAEGRARILGILRDLGADRDFVSYQNLQTRYHLLYGVILNPGELKRMFATSHASATMQRVFANELIVKEREQTGVLMLRLKGNVRVPELPSPVVTDVSSANSTAPEDTRESPDGEGKGEKWEPPRRVESCHQRAYNFDCGRNRSSNTGTVPYKDTTNAGWTSTIGRDSPSRFARGFPGDNSLHSSFAHLPYPNDSNESSMLGMDERRGEIALILKASDIWQSAGRTRKGGPGLAFQADSAERNRVDDGASRFASSTSGSAFTPYRPANTVPAMPLGAVRVNPRVVNKKFLDPPWRQHALADTAIVAAMQQNTEMAASDNERSAKEQMMNGMNHASNDHGDYRECGKDRELNTKANGVGHTTKLHVAERAIRESMRQSESRRRDVSGDVANRRAKMDDRDEWEDGERLQTGIHVDCSRSSSVTTKTRVTVSHMRDDEKISARASAIASPEKRRQHAYCTIGTQTSMDLLMQPDFMAMFERFRVSQSHHRVDRDCEKMKEIRHLCNGDMGKEGDSRGSRSPSSSRDQMKDGRVRDASIDDVTRLASVIDKMVEREEPFPLMGSVMIARLWELCTMKAVVNGRGLRAFIRENCPRLECVVIGGGDIVLYMKTSKCDEEDEDEGQVQSIATRLQLHDGRPMYRQMQKVYEMTSAPCSAAEIASAIDESVGELLLQVDARTGPYHDHFKLVYDESGVRICANPANPLLPVDVEIA